MTASTKLANKLSALLAALRRKAGAVAQANEPADPMMQLLHAFCRYDANGGQAERAVSKLLASTVDLNDLRVSDTADIIAFLGPRYPRVQERATRLKQTLNAVYQREHSMDLSRLTTMAKREARAYLDGLEGITPFVAANVALVALGAHAVPVDRKLLDRLVADGVFPPETDEAQAQSLLEHYVKADEGLEVYALLRAYAEKPIKVDMARAAAGKPSRKKKTTRKKARTKKKTKTSTRARAARRKT